MPQDTPPFVITEDRPTPIVRDFDGFLDAAAQPTAFLTQAKRTLDRASLYAANTEMLTFQTEAHPRMDQEYYALLNLFQRICMSARLHVPGIERGKLRMQPTASLTLFRALTPAERYLALLEAMWVECDWEELRSKHSWTPVLSFAELPKLLASAPAGREIRAGEHPRTPLDKKLSFVFRMPDAVRIFSFLGFLTFTTAAKCMRAAYFKGEIEIASFTLSPLGKAFLPVLAAERPYEDWNQPLLQGGEETALSPLGFLLGDEEEPEEPSDTEELSAEEGDETPPEPFHQPFCHLLPEGAVTRGLPRIESELKDQTFVFGVSLARARRGPGAISRTIALSSEHTLDDLHLAIQHGFKFDNDHLYAFYMDSKPYSRNAYNDPRGGEGPLADGATLGLLNLYPRQRILYLFDFGDSWQFDVELLEVRDEHHKGRPKVIGKAGMSPQQYPSYEEDEE